MKTTTSQNRSRQSRRSAFSLVELMVVIVVISILLAMLLPAISSARTSAQVAGVVSEMKVIEKGLEDFKLKFGTYPPSSIILYETGTSGSDPHWEDDTTSPGVANQNERDTRRRKAVAAIRQMWPNFDFTINRDINGDGDTDDALVLDGAECLMFFLGGMNSTKVSASGADIRTRTGSLNTAAEPGFWAPNGFSTNPSNPFARSTGSRIGPFFEFSDLTRIVNHAGDETSGEAMPELRDSIPNQIAPLVYMSSYEGRGYDAGDLPSGGVYGSLADIYRKDGSASTDTPYNQQTFQIISPGFDFSYGTGGHYDGNSVSSSVNGANRSQDERDNIGNFSGGMLN